MQSINFLVPFRLLRTVLQNRQDGTSQYSWVGQTCVLKEKLQHLYKSITSTECLISDLALFSLYKGTTTDGRTFEEFLGNNSLERDFLSNFDDFLNESFGKWMI